MIICALFPLLGLRAALGRELPDRPVAVAPQEGRPSRIGEISPVARTLGVRPGMRLSEAMDICPTLALVPPDPVRAEAIHEDLLLRLESVGARVASEYPGEAFFAAGGLVRLHGETDGVLDAARRAIGPVPALAAAPTAFAAGAVAREAAPGETLTLPQECLLSFLAGLPVGALSGRLGVPAARERELLGSMARLSLDRLGDLARLSADQVADRFGPAGSRARQLALGRAESVRGRQTRDPVAEAVELPEDAPGAHLAAGLSILCDRVAARLALAGLTARTLVLEARLAGGGSWSREFIPRRPTASPSLLRILLAPVPEQLPRPPGSLGLRVVVPAPAGLEQLEVAPRPQETRRLRLDEAARQVRAAVGDTGLMRVLEAEPGSRLPERRVLLGPYVAE